MFRYVAQLTSCYWSNSDSTAAATLLLLGINRGKADMDREARQ